MIRFIEDHRNDHGGEPICRVLLIALSGGLSFGLGWFLSPQAAQFRLAIAAVLAGILVLTVIVDEGVLGWGLTFPMSIAAFMAGLGYWARGVVDRFMEPPKIFGDSEWASNSEVNDAGLLEPKGVRLGYSNPKDEHAREMVALGSFLARNAFILTDPNTQAHALQAAERVPTLIQDGPTQPFYKAYDQAATDLSKDLGITRNGAKALMKNAYQTTHQRDFYEESKRVEDAYHKPVREAEIAARKQDQLERDGQNRSLSRSMS